MAVTATSAKRTTAKTATRTAATARHWKAFWTRPESTSPAMMMAVMSAIHPRPRSPLRALARLTHRVTQA